MFFDLPDTGVSPPHVQPAEVSVAPPPIQTVDLTPLILAMENLEQRVGELTQEVSHMRDAGPVTAQTPVPQNTTALLEEVRAVLKSSAEGQDRLLLSILETVRDIRKGGSDAHEKIEDALKYLIDKVREDVKVGKKKWF